MKKTTKKCLGVFAMAMLTLIPSSLRAQDSFEVTIGADFVNKYVWRGFDQGSGACIQPTLGLGWKGLSLTAWGSTSITALEPKEIDITLGYEIGGLSLALTDYWWNGESGNYGYYKDSHFYEAAVGYCFGEKVPLSLSAAVMFHGDKNLEGKNHVSAYFNAAYDINLPQGVVLTPSIGVTTKSYLYREDKKTTGITDINLKGSKEIKITDSFSIPVFAQVTVSPVMDKAYLVFGMSF